MLHCMELGETASSDRKENQQELIGMLSQAVRVKESQEPPRCCGSKKYPLQEQGGVPGDRHGVSPLRRNGWEWANYNPRSQRLSQRVVSPNWFAQGIQRRKKKKKDVIFELLSPKSPYEEKKWGHFRGHHLFQTWPLSSAVALPRPSLFISLSLKAHLCGRKLVIQDSRRRALVSSL